MHPEEPSRWPVTYAQAPRSPKSSMDGQIEKFKEEVSGRAYRSNTKEKLKADKLIAAADLKKTFFK